MDEKPITIVLLGDCKCGKTSFLSWVTLSPLSYLQETKLRYSWARRVSSRGRTGPITLLRDIDQPYVFEVIKKAVQYRLEFYDTASPENWKTLQPDIVILCYDISQRLSLIHLQRFVHFPSLSTLFRICCTTWARL